ncbi:MAG: DNA primase, partial [Candidatus Aenigmarchaeota archaeon]|nr:DNA primase [Candidatus Aenigmarchaeota archaeon]
MAKIAQTSIKYLIRAKFRADGMVEKPDVIGALFGQTEGLLGQDLDLRELQRTGRIGRIEVNITVIQGKATGTVTVPASLDGAETALIAAAIETIDRVGPCNAKIMVEAVEDLRTTKRKYIIDRAKDLLSSLLTQVPETTLITDELMQTVRSAEITEYMGLAAGPDTATAEEIVICEGRADVIMLLRHGVKNAIAVGGTSMPPQITKISKEHQVTVFLDGDRGGDLILKELKAIADIDFVARAPEGKEVEE